MKTLLCMALPAAIAACGNDVTAPQDLCLQAKKDFLTERYGPTFSPTPELLNQKQINLGGGSYVTFSVVNGGCQVVVTP